MSLLILTAAIPLSVAMFLCCWYCYKRYKRTSSQIHPSLDPHTTEGTQSKGSTSSLSEISSRASRALNNSGRQVDALVQAEEGNISETHTSLYSEAITVSQSESEGEELSWLPTKLYVFSKIPGFHSFIAQRVIPGFEGQRQQRYQFAVLLLIPERDLNNIHSMNFQPQDNNQQPLVNNAYHYWPSPTHYRNYVAARPQGTLHSEITLLQELPHLWEAFVANYRVIPSYVILYSWMMPCPDCTERICQTFQNTNTSVIVAYTIDWKEIPDDDNEKSRNRLQASGIKVEKVKYDPYLPPA